MINFTNRTQYYMSPVPTDMRNGRNGLAGIIREVMGEDPYDYDKAYIFYSNDGKFLKPKFMEIRKSHKISREVLILFMSSAVQTEIAI